ncbi:MAG: 50S ribosomal protein L22 [Candidatus Liptonbacteria bacterium GWC1_60_9]|uniref:Large ribosomal subunit protein uL22 n=3 Tax=Candidatus Liptoniibacteriota TaxID=1817909 RepID=A0A1G2CLJ5_9BACT|nr:MAG: 50S ribosomal protein L22 [Parcubacteria group bacterium GW2011_GWA1_60_11]OGY97278.1 MAG: 50S ribosomal protein L22 [Candidatus Liptonbacteria bacterium GWC1_60_9]OGY98733.1 MAG: 50S ribosomal protein L22 [Candidatus Liptonbacteria bacterium RIFCSPHIGHO2_12_FULL_60_13]OGZ02273.1 MAG: 50S ribosomal protein L22 [Candidatus Liptonbacteria bacterium RIFCSPLOWO2_12_FULL_60_15]
MAHSKITRDQLSGVRETAALNYLRVAPRKVRAVADLIRGLPVQEAEAQLALSPRRPAQPLLKLLRSAVANAKNNRQLPTNRLMIEEIRVDQGPMLKRFMPRARGSASMIQKKMSHVTLVLAETKQQLPERFTITVKKRTKAQKIARKSAPERAQEAERARPAPKQPGLFKRLFQRKSV